MYTKSENILDLIFIQDFVWNSVYSEKVFGFDIYIVFCIEQYLHTKCKVFDLRIVCKNVRTREEKMNSSIWDSYFVLDFVLKIVKQPKSSDICWFWYRCIVGKVVGSSPGSLKSVFFFSHFVDDVLKSKRTLSSFIHVNGWLQYAARPLGFVDQWDQCFFAGMMIGLLVVPLCNRSPAWRAQVLCGAFWVYGYGDARLIRCWPGGAAAGEHERALCSQESGVDWDWFHAWLHDQGEWVGRLLWDAVLCDVILIAFIWCKLNRTKPIYP